MITALFQSGCSSIYRIQNLKNESTDWEDYYILRDFSKEAEFKQMFNRIVVNKDITLYLCPELDWSYSYRLGPPFLFPFIPKHYNLTKRGFKIYCLIESKKDSIEIDFTGLTFNFKDTLISNKINAVFQTEYTLKPYVTVENNKQFTHHEPYNQIVVIDTLKSLLMNNFGEIQHNKNKIFMLTFDFEANKVEEFSIKFEDRFIKSIIKPIPSLFYKLNPIYYYLPYTNYKPS